MPLRVGTCTRAGCEPFFLARDLGFFEPAPIRLVEYASGTEILRNFRNSAIDGAAITLDEVLLLSQYVPEVRIVLVIAYSNGADAIVAEPEIETFQDLRGKRIGVENSAYGAYVLARALDINDLARTSVEIVTLPIDQQLRAFQTDQVDAVVTYDPVRSVLVSSGANVVFDSRSIPGEMVEVLAIHKRYLEQYPNIAQTLINGWFEATDFMTASPDEAKRRMAEARGLPLELLTTALHGFVFPTLRDNLSLLAASPPRLIAQEERLAAFMLQMDLLQERVPLRALPYGDIVVALAQKKGGD